MRVHGGHRAFNSTFRTSKGKNQLSPDLRTSLLRQLPHWSFLDSRGHLAVGLSQSALFFYVFLMTKHQNNHTLVEKRHHV